MASWPSSLLNEDIHPFGWLGLSAALCLLLALRFLLPPRERQALRHPLTLLLLHLAIVLVRAALPAASRGHDTLEFIARFLLFACLGVASFLLVNWLVRRRLHWEIPRIVEDVLQGLVYGVAGIFTLRAAGMEPTSLLTTSALLTAVIGLSLQDTLGNLFAGLAIQAQRPFEVGDWVQFDDRREHIGRIVEINWRAAKVLTIENVEVTVPNSMLAKAALRNYSKPEPRVRVSVAVPAPFDWPPRKVQELLLGILKDVPGIAHDANPMAVITNFSERGVEYELRYFIQDFSQREIIAGMVRERIWYVLRREGVMLPVPQRAVWMRGGEEQRRDELEEQVKKHVAALRGVEYLKDLPNDVLTELAQRSRTVLFAPGEFIIRQGDVGSSLHVVLSGSVRVMVSAHGHTPVELAQLKEGDVFGEISVMTGEPRSASVRAITETRVLELRKEAVRGVVERTPELMETMSKVLEERLAKVEASTSAYDQRGAADSDHSGELLHRIKRFFST